MSLKRFMGGVRRISAARSIENQGLAVVEASWICQAGITIFDARSIAVWARRVVRKPAAEER
jgi:hypothetical protein